MSSKIVVLTGAGVSAESGIQTFRGANGLWQGYDIMEVASPQGWAKHPEVVLSFYNQRRKQAHKARPNAAHIALAGLERHAEVQIITQNVDALHEKAGSTQVLHLHGELNKARSTVDEKLVYEIGDKEICLGDNCEKGSQLRPHIVWFGEHVPNFQKAIELSSSADILLVIGTSMTVYPANTLVQFVPKNCHVFVIDPHKPQIASHPQITFIEAKATEGVSRWVANFCKI